MNTILLAGDVGGTNTRLALYSRDDTGLNCLVLRSYASDSEETLEAIVRRFLAEHAADHTVAAACFGVPGPVMNGTVRLTNLPWQLQESSLAGELGMQRLRLVNDHVATAASLPLLSGKDLMTLYSGSGDRECHTFAILAPGTGLGQACLHVDAKGRLHPIASEGGHVAFSPTCEIQVALLNYVRRKLERRVSYEQILSGAGIQAIYAFLRDSGRWDEPAPLREELKATADPAAVISDHARNANYPICVRTIDIFAAILGARAGDLVLNYLATGGIFLGGGISQKIADYLRQGCMLDAYRDKGRLSYLVEATPLSIIMHDHPALLGAAAIAWDQC
ncbi:MAG: glucokinase [Desulfobulbaceae bacterium A2]|nr:MAG: glucokinase [Desulfobulbaceae bacterium A2]